MHQETYRQSSLHRFTRVRTLYAQELRSKLACRRPVRWVQRFSLVTEEGCGRYSWLAWSFAERESIRDGNHLKHITAAVQRLANHGHGRASIGCRM